MLQHFKECGEKLDAYLVKVNPNTDTISAGVRYGENGSEYLSPYMEQTKLQALLEKVSPRKRMKL